MSEPLSWQVLQALQTRLQQVRVSNGYHTDIGADVRIDDVQAEEINAPVVTITATDFSRNAQASSQRLVSTDMTFSVEVFVPITEGAYLMSHRVRADVLRALRNTSGDMPKGDSGTTKVDITSDRIIPRPDGASLIAVQITAQAGLSERIPAQ